MDFNMFLFKYYLSLIEYTEGFPFDSSILSLSRFVCICSFRLIVMKPYPIKLCGCFWGSIVSWYKSFHSLFVEYCSVYFVILPLPIIIATSLNGVSGLRCISNVERESPVHAVETSLSIAY